MYTLEHLCEPAKLLLTWQGLDSSKDPEVRTRRVVAELVPRAGGQAARLHYLVGTPDFETARQHGFQGYPAFRLPKSADDSSVIIEDAMPALMRRLPPRKREDFGDYLKNHSLPTPFVLSDFALLGYTGARLPSDGFGLVPVFHVGEETCEFVSELAGTRYYATREQLEKIKIGDEVNLIPEPSNSHDSKAIRAETSGISIGYVNRVMTQNIHEWFLGKAVTAYVARKNGTVERPLIYIRIIAKDR